MKIEPKHVALYLGAGALALVWSTVRAGQNKTVWPGFKAGDKPPGALTGAAETVLFWPAAVLHNLAAADKPLPPSTPAAEP